MSKREEKKINIIPVIIAYIFNLLLEGSESSQLKQYRADIVDP